MTTAQAEQSKAVLAEPRPNNEYVGLFHIYPRWPTQLGDRALCGYVKRAAGKVTRYGDHPDLCVICNEFYEKGCGS